MNDRLVVAISWILGAVTMAAALLATLTPSMAQDATLSVVSSPSPNVHGNTFNAVIGLSSNDIRAVGFQNDNQLNGSRTLTNIGMAARGLPLPVEIRARHQAAMGKTAEIC